MAVIVFAEISRDWTH